MANPEHLAILKQGTETWNKWMSHRNEMPNLSEADLRGLELAGAFFVNADLYGVDLRGANLQGTAFLKSNLNSADLRCADVSAGSFMGSSLRVTSLDGANLTGCELSSAEMFETGLKNTELAGAVMGYTIVAQTDLSTAKSLDKVMHTGPSTIGTDTLYLSKGKIPEVFLRGCGVPEEMIQFARSIAGSPIEFNSCFISYSTKDEEFAQRLYLDLQANGVRCWFAPHDLKGGRKLHEQINRAIHYHDRLLLLLSPDSINSEWVKREIDKARKKEAEENRDVLFPISLVNYSALKSWEYIDPDTGADVAKEIRSYFIPDFSNWKDHDSYQAAFKKLLEDLKGERTKAAPD